ncbi:MAG: class I tRNA ligase family protein, partial [Fulvivirga sp.]
DLVTVNEPFKKLINQGMIQGVSSLVYRLTNPTYETNKEGLDVVPEIYLSKGVVDRIKKSNLTRAEKAIIEKLIVEGIEKFNNKHNTSYSLIGIDYDNISPIHVDINLVKNDQLDLVGFKNWLPSLNDSIIITEPNGEYICGHETEKMSKRYHNVVNPDDIINRYGADTLRLYEMFLGPLEQFKPWNTNGIDGVFKFLRKFWNLFHDDNDNFIVSDKAPTNEALKILHKTIKKAQEDIERYSFNTSVSEFMICVNELTALKCNNRQVLTDLLILISPYAPHIAEELWQKLGNNNSITQATYPLFDATYLMEDSHEYPVSVNGKMRVKMSFPVNMPREDIEKEVLSSEVIQKWLEGKTPKKVIVVPKKIINVVV